MVNLILDHLLGAVPRMYVRLESVDFMLELFNSHDALFLLILLFLIKLRVPGRALYDLGDSLLIRVLIFGLASGRSSWLIILLKVELRRHLHLSKLIEILI